MKSKTKQKNTPWEPAIPYILDNLQQQKAVSDVQQPRLNEYSGMQMDTYGRVAPGAEAGITGAQSLVNANLSGANLNGNPYLDAIIAKRTQDVAGGVSDQFSEAGRYGSGRHADILARAMADANDQLRFQNYGMERGYQQDAIGDAQNLMGGSQSLLNNAAELPWIGIQAANGAVRQASSGYGVQTTKSKAALGPMLAQAAGNAAGAFAASDRRLKMDIEKVGEEADGLGLYRYRYVTDQPDAPLRDGVMADEVAQLRPWALGPKRGEFATVNYAAL